MTDKELRKLHKSELIEVLYEISKELENVRKENEELKQQIKTKDESHGELMMLVRETAENVRNLCGIESNENSEERSGEDS